MSDAIIGFFVLNEEAGVKNIIQLGDVKIHNK